MLHGTHAARGAQCRDYRRSDRCYHLHDKFNRFLLSHNVLMFNLLIVSLVRLPKQECFMFNVKGGA